MQRVHKVMLFAQMEILTTRAVVECGNPMSNTTRHA
jgi:hypothetical protein